MDDDLNSTEVSSQNEFTKEYVETRVEEWKNRLNNLFKEVKNWATKNGWQINDSGTVIMDEELMQKYSLSSTTQPTLRLDNEHGYALFKPKGLWVIGANGRIDLYTSKGTYIIVDLAKYEDKPKWTIFRATDKQDGDLFVPELIADIT